MLIGVCANIHMSKLKPLKLCSPACVVVSAPTPVMSGAASSSDVSASLAKARTATGAASSTDTDASLAKARTVRWTRPAIEERPAIEDIPGEDLPLTDFLGVVPPLAKAGTHDVLAGTGFEGSVARASFLAMTKFFNPSKLLAARSSPLCASSCYRCGCEGCVPVMHGRVSRSFEKGWSRSPS